MGEYKQSEIKEVVEGDITDKVEEIEKLTEKVAFLVYSSIIKVFIQFTKNIYI
ncbi:MAG: hypothetical protein ACTSP3_12260 [Candidatus Heimdallarchaeaceae archaeon]